MSTTEANQVQILSIRTATLSLPRNSEIDEVPNPQYEKPGTPKIKNGVSPNSLNEIKASVVNESQLPRKCTNFDIESGNDKPTCQCSRFFTLVLLGVFFLVFMAVVSAILISDIGKSNYVYENGQLLASTEDPGADYSVILTSVETVTTTVAWDLTTMVADGTTFKI